MPLAKNWISDFFTLFYPKLCYVCHKSLVGGEECICSYCSYHLPRTLLHTERENTVTRIFWGRADIETATALFYFQKKEKVQKLMHLLKYKGKKDIGIYLGKILGRQLKDSPLWQPVDVIIPVPMHPAKQHQRGYNQSEVIAQGISEGFGKPLLTRNLIKADATDTQTRKTRFKRWKNVESVFTVKDPEALRSKNILLVDDVVTTGSTLEACTQKLKEVKGTRVWIATLAMTV